MDSTGKFYQTFKKEIISILHKLFQNIEEEGTASSSFGILGYQNQSIASKEICGSISLLSMDSKILNKILASQIQQYTKS